MADREVIVSGGIRGNRASKVQVLIFLRIPCGSHCPWVMGSVLFFKKYSLIYFIWLLVASRRIFHWDAQTLVVLLGLSSSSSWA